MEIDHYYLLASVISIYLVLASWNVYDLLVHSKRGKKTMWLLVIIFLPFAGAIIYDQTKKRRRRSHWL